MRVAAIDIGSNSTRLLIADVEDGDITEVTRRSIVTRLGDGVDRSGALNAAAIERTVAALKQYGAQIDEAGCERAGGVATSAVREAANGNDFAALITTQLQMPFNVIDGDHEAELTFRGAASGGALESSGRCLVVDIGGGSTEFIVGTSGHLEFHTSTRLGCVRHSERHLAGDPPTTQQLEALLDEAKQIITDDVPAEFRAAIDRAIAVAGTPTSLASVDLALERFDPWKVHGHPITRPACERMLAELAAVPLSERREITGLHPDRAPTIVAGAAILLATMRAFALEEVSVSEHDLLYGLAFTLADA